MIRADKKRVLLITPFAPPNVGGAEVHLADYYDYLRTHGYEVTLLTYQPLTTKATGAPVEKQEHLTIHRYQWIGHNLFSAFEKYPPICNFLYLTPYLLLRSFLFLLRHHHDIDIIHVFGLNSAFMARILKIFFRKPIYVSMEALYYFDPQTVFARVCRWVLKEFEVVFVGSLDSHNEIMNLGIGKEKIVVFTHWINLKHFPPGNKAELKKRLGWKNVFTVIYIGRLIALKGIHVFLEVARVADSAIQFKIIGTGDEEETVRQAARRLPNLEFLGTVPNRELAAYYAAADVLLYPALYAEDLSLVLLESLASGTPVINTNPGSGIYQLNEQVAFIVKPDPALIVEKIQLLYTDDVLQKRMSEASAAFAQRFGPELAHLIADAY